MGFLAVQPCFGLEFVGMGFGLEDARTQCFGLPMNQQRTRSELQAGFVKAADVDVRGILVLPRAPKDETSLARSLERLGLGVGVSYVALNAFQGAKGVEGRGLQGGHIIFPLRASSGLTWDC